MENFFKVNSVVAENDIINYYNFQLEKRVKLKPKWVTLKVLLKWSSIRTLKNIWKWNIDFIFSNSPNLKVLKVWVIYYTINFARKSKKKEKIVFLKNKKRN